MSAARLPRYLVILRLWHALALPDWAAAALVLSAVGWMVLWPPHTRVPPCTGCARSGHDSLTRLSFVSPIMHISTSAAMLYSIREARLRPEYAALYPDLTPGVWVPACTLRDFILERGLYQRRTGSPSHRRLLLEGHFEFRGGTSVRSPGWTGPHERSDEAVGPA